MDKRSALETARLALQSVTIHHEIPSDHPIRTEAASQGYHYLRIAVTNMDTGITLNFYTMRPHHGYGPFINDLIADAKWPGELLEKLSVLVADDEIVIDHDDRTNRTSLETTRVYSPFSTEPIRGHGTYNARKIADKQLSGGRKKSGMSDTTKQTYHELVTWYYRAAKSEPDITEREFCRRHGVSRRKLARALNYYASKNRP